MATYKAEALHQKYAGGALRARAPTTRSAGCRGGPRWPPRGARLATGCCGSRPVARLAKAARRHRPAPLDPGVRPATLRGARAGRPRRDAPSRPDVWIWADSFTDHFSPQSGLAAIRVLESAGLRVRVIDETPAAA